MVVVVVGVAERGLNLVFRSAFARLGGGTFSTLLELTSALLRPPTLRSLLLCLVAGAFDGTGRGNNRRPCLCASPQRAA